MDQSCRNCRHWQPLERNLDEEAPCEVIDAYIKNVVRNQGPCYTVADFCCHEFIAAVFDRFIVRGNIVEEWGC